MILGTAYLLPPLSFGGVSIALPSLRFHTPLVAPNGRISRIRRSDKYSCFRPRKVAGSERQIDQSQFFIEELIGEACQSPALNLVFPAQPPS